MTTLNHLQLKQSSLREKLNSLIGKDSLTDEERSELESATNEMRDLEPKLRAAIVAQDAENAKANEGLGEVRTRATLGGYWNAIIQGRSLTGAEDEMNKELGLASNQVPWEMFEVQERAATQTTNYDGGLMARPVLSRIFARDVFDALGVRLDSVGAGETEYVLLTGGQAPAMKSEGATAPAAVASTFKTETLKPKRLSAQIEFSRELLASVSGIEAVLRNDLLASMRDQMNVQVLTGNGTSPNVSGLFQNLTKPTYPSSVATWEDFVKSPAAAVDGIHASMSSEIGIVMSPEAYQVMSGLFHNGSGESAATALNRVARSVVVNAHIPKATTTGGAGNRQGSSEAIFSASGIPGAHVGAIWQGVSLITDELTLADKGQIRVHAYALWDFYANFREGATRLVSWKLRT